MQPLNPCVPPLSSLRRNVIVFWRALSACVSDIDLVWEDDGRWEGGGTKEAGESHVARLLMPQETEAQRWFPTTRLLQWQKDCKHELFVSH